jgi:hypothetical protein
MADNPSIVNDESGNNYGGISMGGSMGQAQMQYLELLQSMAAKMPPKALPNNAYFPGGNDVQIGSSSSKTLGSQPIFAASNLIPFGMLDEMKRNQAEQEVEYYKNLKTQLDKPLIDAKIKLNDVWKQPEFASKIQDTIDKHLDSYASKLGGNYMQAQIALAHDRNFQRTMQGYAEYASVYNNVFDNALNILKKASEPAKYFVPDEELAEARKFIDNHDKLGELSIESLLKNQREFVFKDSIFNVAEAATRGIKDQVNDEYKYSKSMSTSDEKIWQRVTTYGSKEKVDSIVSGIIKGTPEYESQRDLLTSLVSSQMKNGIAKSIEKIKQENADRDTQLRNMGVKIDEDGKIAFQTKPSIVTGNIGVNAVNYPVNKNQPTPTVSGMAIYIRDPKGGGIRKLNLKNSYDMIPTSEYDLTDEGMAVERGRYIEGKIDFREVVPYQADTTRPIISKGKKVGEYDTGEARETTQIKPVQATDDAGNVVELFGEVTILTPFETMKGQVEANIPAMQYVHEQLEKATYPQGNRRPFSPLHSATGGVITPPDDATLDFFKDDPNVLYRWGDQVLTGAYIHKNTKK